MRHDRNLQVQGTRLPWLIRGIREPDRDLWIEGNAARRRQSPRGPPQQQLLSGMQPVAMHKRDSDTCHHNARCHATRLITDRPSDGFCGLKMSSP